MYENFCWKKLESHGIFCWKKCGKVPLDSCCNLLLQTNTVKANWTMTLAFPPLQYREMWDQTCAAQRSGNTIQMGGVKTIPTTIIPPPFLSTEARRNATGSWGRLIKKTGGEGNSQRGGHWKHKQLLAEEKGPKRKEDRSPILGKESKSLARTRPGLGLWQGLLGRHGAPYRAVAGGSQRANCPW